MAHKQHKTIDFNEDDTADTQLQMRDGSLSNHSNIGTKVLDFNIELLDSETLRLIKNTL